MEENTLTMNTNASHLCGGVYLSLLNDAREKEDPWTYPSDQKHLMLDLNHVVTRDRPKNQAVNMTSVETAVSHYINCDGKFLRSKYIDLWKPDSRKSMSEEMGQNQKEEAFDPTASEATAASYERILYRMDKYVVKKYLLNIQNEETVLDHTEDNKRLFILVSSLLLLIKEDNSIDKEAEFYIQRQADGSSGHMTGGMMCQQRHVQLQPFLLGVLYHVVTNDQNNKEGAKLGAETLAPDGWLAGHSKEIENLAENISLTVLLCPDPDADHLQEKSPRIPRWRTNPSSYRLIEQIPVERSVFEGRADEMLKIDEAYAKKSYLFLRGVGGIGKTELAKRYALKFKQGCEQAKVVFINFKDDILHTVGREINISGLDQNEGESLENFYTRKLRKLQEVADENTLLILDNFNADWDPELDYFLGGSYKVLITTQNFHPSYPEIEIKELGVVDDLLPVFRQYYEMPPGKRTLAESNIPYVKKLIEQFQCHTYMVELLAKQLAVGHISAEKLLDRYTDYGNFRDQHERVEGREGWQTPYEHMRAVFSVSCLSSEEQQTLREMSLLDIQSIDADLFMKWSKLSDEETISSLIRRGLVHEDDNVYSVHPLVQAVTVAELCPDTVNCSAFLNELGKWMYHAWGHQDEINRRNAQHVLSIARYFSPFREGDMVIWCRLPDFLWQVGEFKKAEEVGKDLYFSCRDQYGINSMNTGYCARILGECFLNWGKEKEARKWFEQAAESMEAALGLTGCSEKILKAKEDDDHPARGHELLESKGCDDLAGCYELLETKGNDDLAWCFERLSQECKEDPDQALRYAGMALRIRQSLEKRIMAGETDITCYVQRWKPYTIDNARTGIALVYQEIARILVQKGQLCEEQGQHKEAYEKYKEALKKADLAVETMEEVPVSCIAPATRIYVKYRLGVCHYYLGMYLCNHGNCPSAPASAAKEFETARNLLEKDCLPVQDGALGSFSRTVLNTKNYLADTYAALGLSEQAKTNYKEIIEALQTHYPNDEQQLNEVTLKLNGLAAE